MITAREEGRMNKVVTREEALDMEDAHNDGLHDELPRQFCPLCDNRPLSSYPTEQQIRNQNERARREDLERYHA
jgi:hypothetical protein